jgi:hypothetical protein
VSGAFRSDPLPFLNSWEYHAQSELRLGLILLGLLNMTIALLSLHAAFSAAWPPFFLMAAGCVMYITALARSLNAGPLRGWTLRRIAWTVGLLTILLSVCLDLLRCLLAASVP